MQRILQADERLIQCGSIGYRRPDGTVERTEPVYQIVKAKDLEEKIDRAERTRCNDIANVLCAKFAKYMEGTT